LKILELALQQRGEEHRNADAEDKGQNHAGVEMGIPVTPIGGRHNTHLSIAPALWTR